jgi:uncharacterized membrane protein YfcA
VTAAQTVALVGIGLLAGVVSTVVSLASLVSYPALLAVGLPPLSANVTNTVALSLVGVGSVVGSRVELVGQARRVRRLGVAAAAGGAAGAGLLLLTPAQAFEYVAPWLVGGASLLLLTQPARGRPARVADRPAGDPAGGPGEAPAGGPGGAPDGGPGGAPASGPGSDPERSLLRRGAVFAVATYTGYFGAAGGILMLAVLVPMLGLPLTRTNAVKNAVSGFANGIAAVGFALFGPVRWAAAAPLAVGFLVGGWLGPALARRLPGPALRITVGCCGLAVAVKLGLATYR